MGQMPGAACAGHPQSWQMTLSEILLTREYATIGADRDLRTRASRGELARILPGAFVNSTFWSQLDEIARYRLRVVAAARIAPATTFSHDSAAALWTLPFFRPPPSRLHAIVDRSSGGRSTAGVTRHAIGGDGTATEIDGARVTSLARTLADVSCMRGFTRAVVMLDRGLRGIRDTSVTASDVARELEELGRVPGYARAARALEFANPLSDSVGESLSRVQFLALGLPIPELQVPFYDDDGLIGFADFYWRQLQLVGEFDGGVKYSDERLYKRDISTARLVERERERERRLRRVSSGVVRWGWTVAVDRVRLAARLAEHGVVPGL